MNKTKMKKVLCVLLLSCMVLTCLAGCGPTEDTEIDMTNRTKITFYARHFEDWSDEFTQGAVDEFNKDPDNTDVYVELKIYDETSYNDALVIARENGNCPDLFFSSYSSLPQDAREENVAPLNDLFDDSVWADLSPNILEFVTYNDQICAFPWFSEPGSIFLYRKDVLSDLGYENAPRTFDELYAICEELQDTLQIGQYALGLPANPSDLAWSTWGLQQNLTGGLAVTEDWMTSRLSDPGYKELCRFFYTCTNKGYANSTDITADGYSNIAEALFYGNTMMTWGGSWSIAGLYELAKEADDYSMIENIGIAPIPTLDGNEDAATATNGGWCYAISSLSSQTKQEAAAKFIKWLFIDNPDVLSRYFVSACMSRIPASVTVAEYLTTVESDVNPEWIAVVNDISSKSIPEAMYPWDVSYEVSNLIQNCVAGTGDFDSIYSAALRDAETNLETLMSRKAYTENPWYDKGE